MTSPIPAEAPPRRTGVRWGLVALVLLLVLIAPASWLARRGASRLEFFHVKSVSVEGTRYLTPATVIERLALDTMRSVWDDTEPLEARLKSMAQVGDVTISRRLPGTLVVSIRENLPVALAPGPRGLEPVDSLGTALPIEPTTDDLDLPVAAQRDKAILILLGDARARNPVLFRRISEIARDGSDGLLILVLPLGTSAVSPLASSLDSLDERAVSPPMLRVRASVGVSAARLADIFPVESDLKRRGANIAELDLRYRDQVIARLQ